MSSIPTATPPASPSGPGSGPAGSSGSGSTGGGSPACPSPCDDIIKKIKRCMATITEKLEDMRIDTLDLFNKAYDKPNPSLSSQTTWVGHQEQVEGLQNRLKRLIDQANNHKPPCPIPAGARRLARQPMPKKPRGY